MLPNTFRDVGERLNLVQTKFNPYVGLWKKGKDSNAFRIYSDGRIEIGGIYGDRNYLTTFADYCLYANLKDGVITDIRARRPELNSFLWAIEWTKAGNLKMTVYFAGEYYSTSENGTYKKVK